MKRFIRGDLAELHQNNVRLMVIGERDNVEPEMMALIDEACELTRENTRLTLVIAFNYGARAEIAARRAAPRRTGRRPARSAPADITPERLRKRARHQRHSRSRRSHPHQRRDPAVELPALAGGLYRACLHRRLLARFRPRTADGGHCAVPRARAPLRRPLAAVAGLRQRMEDEHAPAEVNVPAAPRGRLSELDQTPAVGSRVRGDCASPWPTPDRCRLRLSCLVVAVAMSWEWARVVQGHDPGS